MRRGRGFPARRRRLRESIASLHISEDRPCWFFREEGGRLKCFTGGGARGEEGVLECGNYGC